MLLKMFVSYMSFLVELLGPLMSKKKSRAIKDTLTSFLSFAFPYLFLLSAPAKISSTNEQQ